MNDIISFDYKEFKEYVKKFEKLQQEFNLFLRKFLLEQAQRAIGVIKKRTPVDTGYLRESWIIGNEAKVIKGYTIYNGAGKSKLKYKSSYDSAFAQQATIDDIQYNGTDLVVVIGNIAEYASFVENGHTTTAGGWINGVFMMKIGIQQIESAMPKRFETAFKTFLFELGVM